MSRSYRKTPIVKTRHGDKYFKTEYNRRIRSFVNNVINTLHVDDLGEYLFPHRPCEYANKWSSKSDGRHWWFGGYAFPRQSGYEYFRKGLYDFFVENCNSIYKKKMRK